MRPDEVLSFYSTSSVCFADSFPSRGSDSLRHRNDTIGRGLAPAVSMPQTWSCHGGTKAPPYTDLITIWVVDMLLRISHPPTADFFLLFFRDRAIIETEIVCTEELKWNGKNIFYC